MANEVTIPCLPCTSLEQSLPFYESLGFVVTYRQKAPHEYAVVKHGDGEIHLYGLKGLVPKDSYSTCLILVPNLEVLHSTFANALRERLGKVPNTGIPRITRFKPKQTRFTVTDTSGNSLIFIQQGGADSEVSEQYKQAGLSKLERALFMAVRLRDFKNDDAAAAKVIDTAVASEDSAEQPLLYAKALITSMELAIVLEDEEKAALRQQQLQSLNLSKEQREQLDSEG